MSCSMKCRTVFRKMKSFFLDKKISSKTTTIKHLPDDILYRILTFLPIKDAFRTTILSKRWLSLCHSIDVYRIDDNDVYNGGTWARFNRFVDAVMLSSRAAQHQQSLKKFYLTCGESRQWKRSLVNCFFKLDEWIEAALGRGVEVLDLCLYDLPAPCSIFSCKTLVVLKLWKVLVRMDGCSVDLPLLKKLDLNDILFKDMEDIMELLSGCPKLEDLSTHCVNGTQGVLSGGYFKPLTKLIKANFSLLEVPFTAVYNVQFLSVLEMGCSLPNEQINSYYQALPLFQNVIELRLSWCSTVLHYWIDVVKMLESCPKLQVLYIDKWIVSPTTEDYPIHVPECVSSHLTTCSITNYEAAEADFRFAAYLLKNARHLQNMRIQLLGTLNIMQRAQCFEDLSSCPRISPACKLSLIERF